MGSWNTVSARETSVCIISLCDFETCSPLPCHSAKRKEKRALGSGNRMHRVLRWETEELRGHRSQLFPKVCEESEGLSQYE